MEAIYLKFDFLKKRLKLLIATPIENTVANIGNTIIYRALSIDKLIKNQK